MADAAYVAGAVGVHVGRPRLEVDHQRAVLVVQRAGSIRSAARSVARRVAGPRLLVDPGLTSTTWRRGGPTWRLPPRPATSSLIRARGPRRRAQPRSTPQNRPCVDGS